MKKWKLGLYGSAALLTTLIAASSYLLPYYYAATIQSRILQRYPLMVLISLRSPLEFQQYIAELKANILNHGDERDEYYFSANLINSQFAKFAAKASDQSLYAFLGSEIQLYKSLFANNPRYVLYVEFPDKFRQQFNLENLNKALPYQAVQDLEKTKEAVITSGIDSKQLLSFNDSQQNIATNSLAEIIKSLNQQYGSQTVSDSFLRPDNKQLSQRVSAEVVIAYYEKIYAQGPQKAGDILRTIYATNTANAAR